MSKITEIVEESVVQLEITEPGGGQIEIIDNSTKLEIVESGSAINPTTLDISTQINTVVIDSVTENTNIDILVSEPTTVETTTTNNILEITEDQVVFQTGSVFNITNNTSTTESITQLVTQSITQSISQSFTTINGDTIFEVSGDGVGVLVESGGLFQNITQSGNDFTAAQIEALKNLIFSEGTANLSVSDSSFEKNKSTNITFIYSFNSNDDVFSSATFDNVDITNNPNGSQLYTDVTESLSKTYVVTFAPSETNINSRNVSVSKTAIARDPQYFGISTIESFNGFTYEDLNNALTKKVQQGDNITQEVSPTDQFVYFLSTNANATITDGNGFDNTENFNNTSITVKYSNGKNQSLNQYRTKQIKTLTNFEYNIT